MVECGNGDGDENGTGDENVDGFWGLEMGMGMGMLASAKGRRKFI